MTNIAVVINTTDKYSFLWDAWYSYFQKNWQPEYPVYFLNEKHYISYPFNQIKINIPEKDLWTKKLRLSIEQIPEEYLFILLEDLFIVKNFSKEEFDGILKIFNTLNADALRVMASVSKYTTVHKTLFKGIWKLDDHSRYLIAHTPNIWRKEFLLECLKVDENPWDNEIKGTKRIQGKGHNIYAYLKKDWYVNTYRQGKFTTAGEKLYFK